MWENSRTFGQIQFDANIPAAFSFLRLIFWVSADYPITGRLQLLHWWTVAKLRQAKPQLVGQSSFPISGVELYAFM